ncbi:hypothetical protein B7463_g2211, partial [Scytalidium lignicola]
MSFYSNQASNSQHQQPQQKGEELSFQQEGYNITENMNALPQSLQNIICTKMFIEFLGVTSAGAQVVNNNAKNHAIIKVDFQTATGGYRGARISMEVDFDLASTGSDGAEPSYKPGKMLVRPCVTSANMHRFYFVNIDDKYFGCRDFITQAFYQMQQYTYVNPRIILSIPATPQMPIDNAFEALDKGHFDYHVRVEAPNMPYAGSQKAQEIQQLISRQTRGHTRR